MRGQKLSAWAINAALLLICLVIGGCISVHLGQDANVDLASYHIYNAWAFLHGRWDLDVFVAGLQGYFSPLIELPYYLLAFCWLPDYPRIVAFLMGLPYGLLVYFTALVAWIVLGDCDVKPVTRAILTILTVAFGTTGVAVLPIVGTTFNDIQTSALVIVGMATLLYGLRHDKTCIPSAASVAGGGLFGLAAALKFTAAIYAPAAALGIFVISQPWRQKFLSAAVFSFSWLTAFILSYGWWGWRVYSTTGNPMYPMFESVFSSPYAPVLDLVDVYHAFKPETLIQWLFYPFFWLHVQVSVVGLGFADPRFAFGMVAMLILAVLYLWTLLKASQSDAAVSNREGLASSSLFVAVFIAASYVEWLRMFSYLRYAVPIEALLGVVVMAAILQVIPRGHIAAALVAIVGMLAVLGAAVAMTVYPDYGHVKYGKRVWTVQPVQLAPHSLVIFFGGPTGYLAPGIADQNIDSVFMGSPGVGYGDKRYALGRDMFRKVNEHEGPIYVLKRTDMDTYSARTDEEQQMDDMLKGWGVSVSPSLCLPFSSNIDWDLEICSARIAGNDQWAPAPRSPWPGTPSVPVVPSSDAHTDTFMVSWSGAALGGPENIRQTYTLYMSRGRTPLKPVYTGESASTRLKVDYDGDYFLKVKACAGEVCSGLSGVNVYETYIKPSEPLDLRVTAGASTHAVRAAYTVSWSVPAVHGAGMNYQLQEQHGSGPFTTIYSGRATSHGVSPSESGRYTYRVIACDVYQTTLCGDPATSRVVDVIATANGFELGRQQ